MKILKNQKITDYINKLNDQNEFNMSLSNLFLDIEGKYDSSVTNIVNKSSYPHGAFVSLIADCLDIDLNDNENLDVWNNHVSTSIKEISNNDFKDNPYLTNIKFPNIKFKNLELTVDHYDPYEIFPLDDIKIKNGLEITSLAYFKNRFNFPCLNENGITWMSVNPNEINTMKNAIEKTTGNVLVYGLGLGYFSYMISLKKEVTKITIIEKDKDIISLFNSYLLPQFKNSSKIEIIEFDALKYNTKYVSFDTVFVDLWHNVEDGLDFYLCFKKIEKENKNTKFIYWLDEGFKAFILRAAITLLYEQNIGYNLSNYSQCKNAFDKLVNLLYFKTKNITISSAGDIDNFLNINNLENLLINDH